MSWGDVWGHAPCNNAIALAKAFYEGRERTFGRSRVEFSSNATKLHYLYNGAVIAWYTPDSCIPQLVARRLAGRYVPEFERQPLEFRCHHMDKGEARHLQALGLQAEWQYGNRPFLICGANARQLGWMTLEQWAAAPKWVETPAVKVLPRVECFVNLTMPLFT